MKESSSASLSLALLWHFIANYFGSLLPLAPSFLHEGRQNKRFLRGRIHPRCVLQTLTLKTYALLARGRGLCAGHTHPTSPTLIECRCVGFSRLIIAVGALKCLPTAVRGGTDTSVSHLFFKLWDWNWITPSLPPSRVFSVHWEGRDCKSRVSSMRSPLGGLPLTLFYFLKSSIVKDGEG